MACQCCMVRKNKEDIVDWFLSITTLLSNSGLGWAKGVWWMWLIHAINAGIWIIYAVSIEQYGLIVLSCATIAIDIISCLKSWGNNARD